MNEVRGFELIELGEVTVETKGPCGNYFEKINGVCTHVRRLYDDGCGAG